MPDKLVQFFFSFRFDGRHPAFDGRFRYIDNDPYSYCVFNFDLAFRF